LASSLVQENVRPNYFDRTTGPHSVASAIFEGVTLRKSQTTLESRTQRVNRERSLDSGDKTLDSHS